jgi:YD repeat-containing protein
MAGSTHFTVAWSFRIRDLLLTGMGLVLAGGVNAQSPPQWFHSAWNPAVFGSCEAMRVPVAIQLYQASTRPGCSPAFILPYVSTSISHGDCWYHVSANNLYGNAVVSPEGLTCAGVGGTIAGSHINFKCVAGRWNGTGTICTTYKNPPSGRDGASPHPIDAASGNKHLREVDIASSTDSAASLKWERYYNGLLLRLGGPEVSFFWTHSFSYYVQLNDRATAYVLRPDGRMFGAAWPGLATSEGLERWRTDSDVGEQVYQRYDESLQATGWQIVGLDGSVERYDMLGNLLSIEDKQGRSVAMVYSNGTGAGGFALDASGNVTTTALPPNLLVEVTDNSGHRLSLRYNANSQLVQVKDPSGQAYRYTFDASGNLASVTYPNGKTRQYRYNESAYTEGANLPNSLTGIVDEKGARVISYRYNGFHRAVETPQ